MDEVVKIYKSGDFVEINGVAYWICECKDAPLNMLKSPVCYFCDLRRPSLRDLVDVDDTEMQEGEWVGDEGAR